MRKFLACFATLSLVGFLSLGLRADDKKSETKPGAKVDLKGDLCCAKCELKVDGVTKCINAIKVKEDGKDVVYLLDDKGPGAEYHGEICQGAKPGSVKGVVVEKKNGVKGYKYVKPGKDGVKIN